MIWNGGEKPYEAAARRGAAWRGVAWRGVAWRGVASEEEERACRSPLLMLIQVVEELTL